MKRHLAFVLVGLALCALGVSTPVYAENMAVLISDPTSNQLTEAFFVPSPPNTHRLAANILASSTFAPGSMTSASIAAVAASLAPSYYQTSEFMLGKVAVGIVMPQCTGTIDKCSETWNQTSITQVVSQINSAMAWWSNRMNGRVTFVFDQRPQTPTGYEPIHHSQSDESYWIGDTMTRMGFGGSGYFEQVYAYNNWMRQTYSTDWAFTIFVANSLGNPAGTFNNGDHAYAYVSGPFIAMTYGNAIYGASNMAAVAAHETGHIFGALDQYKGARVPCTETGGYLSVQNQNSDIGCALNLPSIMRGGTAPYLNNQIDLFALAMVGNRTSSGTLPDPINTKPLVVLDPITLNSANPTITGTAQDQPFNTVSGNAVTINFITSVQYRVDGGVWQNAAPLGGDASFNQVAQGFAFTPAVTNGTHTIEVQAINRVNHASNIVRVSITVQNPLPQPTTIPPTPTRLPPISTATSLPPVRTVLLNPTVVAPTVVPIVVAPGGAILIQINAGTTTLSLPYSGYKASSLIAAINAQAGNATEVNYWNGKDWGSYKTNGDGDFNIDVGMGYIVKANSQSTWVVPSNTHNPFPEIKIDRGWNMLGVPACKDGSLSCYTASTLAAEINSHGGGVAEIDRLLNGSWSAYLVGYLSNNFPIVMGQGYFVRSTKEADWTP